MDLSNVNDIPVFKDVTKMSALEAFGDDCVIDKLRKAMTPLLATYQESLDKANAEIRSLKDTVANHQVTITKLTREIEDLHIKIDDTNQRGKKLSVGISGVPENTRREIDDKIISSVINQEMASNPLVMQGDLEVMQLEGLTSSQAASDLEPSAPLIPSAPPSHYDYPKVYGRSAKGELDQEQHTISGKTPNWLQYWYYLLADEWKREQMTSLYPNGCWPISLSPHGVTRPKTLTPVS